MLVFATNGPKDEIFDAEVCNLQRICLEETEVRLDVRLSSDIAFDNHDGRV